VDDSNNACYFIGVICILLNAGSYTVCAGGCVFQAWHKYSGKLGFIWRMLLHANIQSIDKAFVEMVRCCDLWPAVLACDCQERGSLSGGTWNTDRWADCRGTKATADKPRKHIIVVTWWHDTACIVGMFVLLVRIDEQCLRSSSVCRAMRLSS
jgi:hypothetical protein